MLASIPIRNSNIQRFGASICPNQIYILLTNFRFSAFAGRRPSGIFESAELHSGNIGAIRAIATWRYRQTCGSETICIRRPNVRRMPGITLRWEICAILLRKCYLFTGKCLKTSCSLFENYHQLMHHIRTIFAQYYCEHCWTTIHSRPGREYHKPLVKEGADRPRAVPFRWC